MKKRNFADVIKNLELGRLWVQITHNNHKDPYKKEAEGSESDRRLCDNGY